jgi:hypothetical protein
LEERITTVRAGGRRLKTKKTNAAHSLNDAVVVTAA